MEIFRIVNLCNRQVCLFVWILKKKGSRTIEKYRAISNTRVIPTKIFSSRSHNFFSFFFLFSIDKYISTKRISFLPEVFTQSSTNCCMLSYGEHVIFFPFVYISFFGERLKGEDKRRIVKLVLSSIPQLNVSWYWFFVFVSQIIIHFERRKKIFNLSQLK